MREELEDSIGTGENNWNKKYVFISELSSARPVSPFLHVQFVHAVTQLVAVAATCCLYSYLEMGKGNESTNLPADWKMIMQAE